MIRYLQAHVSCIGDVIEVLQLKPRMFELILELYNRR